MSLDDSLQTFISHIVCCCESLTAVLGGGGAEWGVMIEVYFHILNLYICFQLRDDLRV